MENAIEIKDLKMTFGKDEVLKGITHSFEKGKVHGIVGNNGSGKTVMMKCICGFLKPTSGEVKVNGKMIGRQEDFPKSLGLIIHQTFKYYSLSCRSRCRNSLCCH